MALRTAYRSPSTSPTRTTPPKLRSIRVNLTAGPEGVARVGGSECLHSSGTNANERILDLFELAGAVGTELGCDQPSNKWHFPQFLPQVWSWGDSYLTMDCGLYPSNSHSCYHSYVENPRDHLSLVLYRGAQHPCRAILFVRFTPYELPPSQARSCVVHCNS